MVDLPAPPFSLPTTMTRMNAEPSTAPLSAGSNRPPGAGPATRHRRPDAVNAAAQRRRLDMRRPLRHTSGRRRRSRHMPQCPRLPIVRTVAELARRGAGLAAAKASASRSVPTMGFLHAGHLSLVRLGTTRADRVVASLFVNPTQFAPSEDFDAYPRDEARDADLLAARRLRPALRADRRPRCTRRASPPRSAWRASPRRWTALARPTHFAGVATIVAKLLTQCQPDVAIFGEKDYQQLLVIRRMARDLDLPVEIVGAPDRARAGRPRALLAQRYLTPAERGVAPLLNAALRSAGEALRAGASVAEAEAEGLAALAAAGFGQVDYFEVRGADDLARLGPGPVDSAGPRLRGGAARQGAADRQLAGLMPLTRPPPPADRRARSGRQVAVGRVAEVGGRVLRLEVAPALEGAARLRRGRDHARSSSRISQRRCGPSPTVSIASDRSGGSGSRP